MAKILDGRKIREERIPQLKAEFSKLPNVATLAIIQVGDRADSNTYINQKKKLAEKLGVKIWHLKFDTNIDQKQVWSEIENLNKDEEIQGIIVQLPLPEGWDKKEVIEKIDPIKDVDGLTSVNQNKLINGDLAGLIPATARGVLTMLDYYGVELKNKKVVVVGRSELVGKPIAILLEKRGAIVTVCHRQTSNVLAETEKADIVVVAAGSPKLLTKEGVKAGQIIVDVGINKMEDGHLSGDVDFINVENIVEAISPVPGGVGPLTVLSLFENLLQVSQNKI
jgi:methylenetetrahydrofolate dehydrogenase (NADP+)/methenyltetrahydrofolate cyclohydrolase